MIRHVKFSPPDISEREIEYVIETLKTGWITTGPRTKQLEAMVAEYCGVEKAVCLNSQTACAELALRVLGVGPGDEVITTAYTYTATASVIEHVGAKIVMVDTVKDKLEMDYGKVAELINENTKAIIPVDLAGIPCDYDRIFEIVEAKKDIFKPKGALQEAIGRVAVLADTAHAFGATYKGKKIGAVADFSSFSFHAVKNLTTAEGGALTWRNFEGIDNEELYKKFQLLSLHGQSKDAFNKSRLGSWEYDIVGPWYKCNMTDIAAAMGVAQLERYGEMLARRKEIIDKYNAALKPLGVITADHFTDTYTSSCHLYITRLPGVCRLDRNEIILEMARRGIACNVHYKPLPLMTAYKNLGFDIADYPNANAYYENEITLPLHTVLSDEDVDYVIENYTDIIKEYLNK